MLARWRRAWSGSFEDDRDHRAEKFVRLRLWARVYPRANGAPRGLRGFAGRRRTSHEPTIIPTYSH